MNRRQGIKTLIGGALALVLGAKKGVDARAFDAAIPKIRFESAEDLWNSVEAVRPNTIVMSMRTKELIDAALAEYALYEQKRWELIRDGAHILETFAEFENYVFVDGPVTLRMWQHEGYFEVAFDYGEFTPYYGWYQPWVVTNAEDGPTELSKNIEWAKTAFVHHIKSFYR